MLQLSWRYRYEVGQLLQISRQEKQASQGSNAAFQLLSSSMALQDWVLHLRLPLPGTLIFPWLHSWSSRASTDCCPVSTSLQTMFTRRSCSRCCKLKEIFLNASLPIIQMCISRSDTGVVPLVCGHGSTIYEGLTIASKIELNGSPDTLGRKKKYIFWFYVVVFLSFFGNASRSCMKYRHIPFQSTALNHK